MKPGANPVINALHVRKTTGTKADGHKIALVIESGGMAGVVTGAQLTAIHDLGLTPCFDSIYANSAGTAGAAYLLAGTPALGTSIYFEDLANDKFLSARRMFSYAVRHFRGRPQTQPPGMDLGYMLDILTGKTRKDKRLDLQKVLARKGLLKIVFTDLDDRAVKTVSDFESPGELLHYIHASCLVPGIAGPALMGENGHRLVDGKVTRNSPVRLALDDGYDMVLVLSARPEGSMLKQSGIAALIDMIVIQFIRIVALDRNEARELARFARDNARTNHEEIEAAKRDPRVQFIGLPQHHKRIASTCINASLLRQCAVTAYGHAVGMLSGDSEIPAVPDLWMPQSI
jgi:predicted patatin/cPLA2 family phospholipase